MVDKTNGGVIVVSGCPRSGTSLMMLLMREALGENRIFGEKFPQLRKREALNAKPGDARHAWRLYSLNEEKKDDPDWFVQTKDMNPNGFWECLFTTQGIHWARGRAHGLDDLLEKEKSPVCKIVSQGLARSDAKYIKKVIFMLRDPGSVAKSQERLKRKLDVIDLENRKKRDLFKGIIVNNTQMFLQVTLAAAQWMKEHPDVPVHFVEYDALLDNPSSVLDGVKTFLGEGDFKTSAKLINPKLKRSKPSWDDDLRENAEHVYDKIKKQDWDALESFAKDTGTVLAERLTAWVCARTGLRVTKRFCQDCQDGKKYRQDAIAQAVAHGIDWKSLPCAYEVSYCKDNFVDTFVAGGDTIEAAFEKAKTKSIEENFWTE